MYNQIKTYSIFTFLVVTYSWAIGVFTTSFTIEQVLKAELQRTINKNDKFQEFWENNRVGKQTRGKCFYLLVGADVIVLVVLLLSLVEFNLSRVVNRGEKDVDDELRVSREQLLSFSSWRGILQCEPYKIY